MVSIRHIVAKSGRSLQRNEGATTADSASTMSVIPVRSISKHHRSPYHASGTTTEVPLDAPHSAHAPNIHWR